MKTTKPEFKLGSEAGVCSVHTFLLPRAWPRTSSTCPTWELAVLWNLGAHLGPVVTESTGSRDDRRVL